MKVWINDKLIEESKAFISVFNRSYLYGEGVFETLMCYEGHPAFLDLHYRRFRKNCGELRLKVPLSEIQLKKAILQLLNINKIRRGVVRMTYSTQGISFGVIGRPKNPKPVVTLFCRGLKIDSELFEKGVRVLPLRKISNDPFQTAGIKSTSYLTKILAREEASKSGAFDSILKNSKGFWVEGSKTNLFIAKDHTVITPPLSDGILPGVTRGVVLEIIRQEGIRCREDHVTDKALRDADEIFLTGSTSEVMPVREMIGLCRKKISPNSLTLKLHKDYQRRILG